MKLTKVNPNQLIQSLGIDFLKDLRSVISVDDKTFKEQYLSLIYRLGEFVQELPLERDSYFGKGGAFQFGVFSAYLTSRMSGGGLFSSTKSTEDMDRLLPQYKYAAFVASIATVPLIVYHNLDIQVDSRNWSYLSRSKNLHEVIQSDYSFTWNKRLGTQPYSSMSGVFVLKSFFDSGFANEFDSSILDELCKAINPSMTQMAGETTLMKIVRMGHEKAKNIDIAQRHPIYTDEQQKHKIDLSQLTAISPSIVEPVKVATEKPVHKPIESTSNGLLVPPVIDIKPKLMEEFPIEWGRLFQEFLNFIKSDQQKNEKLVFNPNDTVSVPFELLRGLGMSPNALIEQFKNVNLIVEVNKTDQFVRFKSEATPYFAKEKNASI